MAAGVISSKDIFTSIQERGLVSRKDNPHCLPSERDPLSQGVICCNDYHPDIPETRTVFSHTEDRLPPGEERILFQLHSLVFNEKTGIYPVSLEKASGEVFDTDEAFLSALACRVQNTVCLILDKEAMSRPDHPKHVFGDFGQPYDGLITHNEVRTQESIPSKHIKHVLAPLHLATVAREVFGDKVLPVPDCVTEKFSLGIINDKAPMVGGSYGVGCEVSLIAPDYYQTLQKLGDLLREGFFTHMVRLPCPPPLVKGEGERKFAIKVGVNVAETVEKLMTDPRFRVRKRYDGDKTHQFYVVCKEADVQALKDIIQLKT